MRAAATTAAPRLDLRARRHQRGAVAIRPTVELHVGEFDLRDAIAFGERDDAGDRVVVAAVQHAVQRQRDAAAHDARDRLELARVDARPGDLVGEQRLGRLHADLHVLEPGGEQAVEQRARRGTSPA